MDSAPDWSALRNDIAGDVVLPGSPGYDAARIPAVPGFEDIRPRAVVRVAADEDVAATIAMAGRAGLPVAVRSGGHCFAGHSSTPGVLIDVSPMAGVSVAASGEEVTVGAGTRLGQLYDVLAGHDRTVPAGCGPTVGIAGLTLGGGLGILGRSHGLTLDHLLAARVVLADGRVVHCDAHHEPGLFWALRGAGGGNFGVVTSLVFRTVPAPPATTFHLVWPYADAAAVVTAWQAWSPAGPDELAASLLLTAPADVDRPPVVNVFGALAGDRFDLDELLDDLVARVGADPASAVRKRQSYRDTKRYLAEHGPGEERPGAVPFSKSEFFARELPAEGIAALLDLFVRDRVAGESRELDFSPWGGAYNRVAADATAFVHRDARFLLKQAVVIDPDTPPAGRWAARHWLTTSWESVHPWGTGGVYPNFPDPDLPAWSPAYYGANRERLLRVKAAYDPTGFFRGGVAPRP